jgi:hypothetical protein
MEIPQAIAKKVTNQILTKQARDKKANRVSMQIL